MASRRTAHFAFVPERWANLHHGHLELARRGRQVADRVVSSVFVNPYGSDPMKISAATRARWSRTRLRWRKWVRIAQLRTYRTKRFIRAAWKSLAKVSVTSASQYSLRDISVPDTLMASPTVVSILFNLVQPDVALLRNGRKRIISSFSSSAAWWRICILPIDIVGIATEREPDGLAFVIT